MSALLHSLVSVIVGSWFPVDTVSSRGLFDVQMVSTDTAFAVGRQGGVLRSVDGGISWNRAGEGLTDTDVREVRFRNPREGMVLGQNLLARTEDGGRTWTRIAPDTDFFHTFLEGNRSGRIFVQSIGGGLRGTDDLGRTWTAVRLRDSVRVGDWNAMDFPTPDTGYAAGWNGTIWRSTNRGESWQKMSHREGSGLKVQAIEFISPRAGLAVFSDGQIHAFRSDTPVGVIPLRGAKVGRGAFADWTRPTWSGFDGLGRKSPQGSTSEGTIR